MKAGSPCSSPLYAPETEVDVVCTQAQSKVTLRSKDSHGQTFVGIVTR